MRRGVDQGALVVLAVDLDQGAADARASPDADRLVVDEDARAAVGDLDAAQDQVAVGVDRGLGQRCAGPGGRQGVVEARP